MIKKYFFIQDILNGDGNFLTFEEFQNKFRIKTNYLHYFQLMAAIPSDLKKKAMSAEVPSHEQLLYSTTVSLSPENTPVDLANMRCKHYYKILNKDSTVEPTGIKTWKINFADEHSEWENKFSFIYHSTRDNKLRQFSFKLLHRILVTKKELLKFRLADDKTCLFCTSEDFIEHTFLDCFVTQSFYSEALIWFNHNNTDISLCNKQIAYTRLHLFVILLKQYIYACKYFKMKPTINEFQSKVLSQWQIEKCALP